MRALRSLSLRARLALALVTLAVLAVGLATLISHRGLQPRLSEAAQARLDRAVERVAEVAASIYAEGNGWNEIGTHNLEHVALLNGLALTVVAPDGTVIAKTEPGEISDVHPVSASASAPVVVGGERVATVSVAPLGDSLLSPEDVKLQDSLDRLDFAAGAISVAAALVLAFVLAQTLSRPLRRIREAAQHMAQGDLTVRVEPSGGAEVRAVGEALNRLAETLQREEELRKQSVDDLAHELRTPVSGLLSRIEAAQDGVIRNRSANLAAMHAEALRLTRLLDDLSRLAEAERPGLLLNRGTVDLAAIARSAAESFSPLFAEKGVRLSAELEPVPVLGDADRLGQIAANLLSNALRYTERDGEARILVRREGDSAVLEVVDTGVGIAAEDLGRIFERFWRGEKSRSRTTGGAGIGLAIVRELVRAHDGRIEVESEPGSGSRFRVLLPALPPEPPHRVLPHLEAVRRRS